MISTRRIRVIATGVQWHALEALNDFWTDVIRAPTPAALVVARAQDSLATGAAWVRSGHPLVDIMTASSAGDLLFVAAGQEIAYWDAPGTALALPGVPGLLRVMHDTGQPVPVQFGEVGPPYCAVTGVMTVSMLHTPDQFMFDIRILACQPREIGA